MTAMPSAAGFFVLLGLAWLLSENRRAIAWKTVTGGVVLQWLLAVLFLQVPVVQVLLVRLNDVMLGLQTATDAGTAFVFGFLGGGPLPFEETRPGASFVLAFRALPLILVVSALSALLFHWRILPRIVDAFAWLLKRTTGIGGPAGVSVAANVFVGMVEAPLFVRPYLARLSRGELFIVMTCGMATIAGTVMILYATIIRPLVPDALGHILTASVISAPAAIAIAALMVPGGGDDEPVRSVAEEYGNAMDAVTQGTMRGLALYLNVVAMLLVLVAMVALADQLFALLPSVAGEPMSLERLFGWLFAPLTWLMGVPWHEAPTAGSLMGTKTVLNELIAYLNLAALEQGSLEPRSVMILTYALCGFANFGSLGIMVGGLTTLLPERRAEVIALGGRSIVSGTLATCCTGAIVGTLWSG
jgi:CNT family concentrative nucleoside transporter